MKKLVLIAAVTAVMIAAANAEYRIRDCSKPPYGASQNTYQVYMTAPVLSDPKGTLQRVCIGQSFPGSEQRKVLMNLGFTVKEIEEKDTADLADEMLDRSIEVLNAASKR